MRNWMLAVAIALAPAALAAPPDSGWGEKPEQAEAEKEAVNSLQAILKDPESARYKWAPIEGTGSAPEMGRDCFGWVLLGDVNAKNSYGGYTGRRAYRFYFNSSGLACIVTKTPMGRYGTETDQRVK